jgi:hypothetical protein
VRAPSREASKKGLSFGVRLGGDVRNGVRGEVAAGPPLRVSYRLTEAGTALDPPVKLLAEWAKGHLPKDERRVGC